LALCTLPKKLVCRKTCKFRDEIVRSMKTGQSRVAEVSRITNPECDIFCKAVGERFDEDRLRESLD
jgi:hypothetical protein